MELDKFSGALPLCEEPNHRTMECGLVCLSKECNAKLRPFCSMCLFADHIQHLKDCISIPDLADQLSHLKAGLDTQRLDEARKLLQGDPNLTFDARWKKFEDEIHKLLEECHDQLQKFINNSANEMNELNGLLEHIGKYLILEPDTLFEDQRFLKFITEMRQLLTNDRNKISFNYTYLEKRINTIIQTHTGCLDSYFKSIENLEMQLAELSKKYSLTIARNDRLVEKVNYFTGYDTNSWLVGRESYDLIAFTCKENSLITGIGQFYAVDNNIPVEVEIIKGDCLTNGYFYGGKLLESFKYEIQKKPGESTTNSYDHFFTKTIKLEQNRTYRVKIIYQKDGKLIYGTGGKLIIPKQVTFLDLALSGLFGFNNGRSQIPYLIFGHQKEEEQI